MKSLLRMTGVTFALLNLLIAGWVGFHRKLPGPSLLAFTRRGFDNSTTILITMPGVVGNRRLNSNATFAAQPSWSADGNGLAFEGWRNGNIEIFSMSRKRQGWRNLTRHPAFDTAPKWSPDGKWIAFNSDREGNPEIFIMHPDGSAVRNISNFAGRDHDPAWSPDSQQIAYVSVRDGLSQIFITDVEGDSPQLFSEGFSPAWSPDGQRIAFVYAHGDENLEIYVMRVDGTDVENLSARREMDSAPAWSPDSQWVVFSAAFGTHFDICKVQLGSTALQCVARDPGHDLTPSWSPDGEWITFVSTRTGNREVFAVRADGSTLINMSAWRGTDGYPIWSPPLETRLRVPLLVLASLGIVALEIVGKLRIGRSRAMMQPYTTWGGRAMPIADSELNKPSNAHIVRPARESVHAALQTWREKPGSYEWWWLIIEHPDHRYTAIRLEGLRDLLHDPDSGVHMNTPLSDLPLNQLNWVKPGVVTPTVVEQDAMGTARALQTMEDSPGRVLVVLKNGTFRGILSVAERTFAFADKPLLDMLDEFEASGNDDTLILPYRPDVSEPPDTPDS